jgi:hypothetical protein
MILNLENLKTESPENNIFHSNITFTNNVLIGRPRELVSLYYGTDIDQEQLLSHSLGGKLRPLKSVTKMK